MSIILGHSLILGNVEVDILVNEDAAKQFQETAIGIASTIAKQQIQVWVN